jgi:hypothetical protein
MREKTFHDHRPAKTWRVFVSNDLLHHSSSSGLASSERRFFCWIKDSV